VTGPEEIRMERRVSASPETVYAYLTDARLWARWQGASARLDPRPGGAYEMRMASGMAAGGKFVELIPYRRVVFTWGWVGHPGLPPGSSTDEIDLIPEADATLLRLVHRDLPADEVANHTTGWSHYLPRLALAAKGGDPRPDPGPRA
jgi:uncharacterized protein YndB with AHSA1/START domain